MQSQARRTRSRAKCPHPGKRERRTRNYNAAVAPLDSADITGLLKAWGQGDQRALEQLMPLVYAQLRAQARRHMRNERSGVDAAEHGAGARDVSAPGQRAGRRLARSRALLRVVGADHAADPRRRRACTRRGQARRRGGPGRALVGRRSRSDPGRRLGCRRVALRAGRCSREPGAARSAAREGDRAAVLRRVERRGDGGACCRYRRKP